MNLYESLMKIRIMRLVWVVIPLVLLMGLIIFQSGLYFEPINAQYLGPSYNEMTDEEREQYDENIRLRLEHINSTFEEEYPNYYYCDKILQIPFGCSLFLGESPFYFLVLGIIVTVSIVILVLRKRN